jgi:hypothetical protein
MIEKSILCEDENRSEKMKQNCKQVVEYINSKEHNDKNKDYNKINGSNCEKPSNYTRAYNKTEVSLYNNKGCFKETKNKLNKHEEETNGSEFF